MVTSFQSKVYKIARKIPKGKVSSYKAIAKRLASSPRAVGQALKKNPFKQVPCHRVIMSDGNLGGFRGKHVDEKIKILKKEGVIIKKGKIDRKFFVKI